MTLEELKPQLEKYKWKCLISEDQAGTIGLTELFIAFLDNQIYDLEIDLDYSNTDELLIDIASAVNGLTRRFDFKEYEFNGINLVESYPAYAQIKASFKLSENIEKLFKRLEKIAGIKKKIYVSYIRKLTERIYCLMHSMENYKNLQKIIKA